LTDYDDQYRRIAELMDRALQAAESAATLGWPGDSTLVDELHLRWESPAAFAAAHPDWFTTRWQVDDLDGWDWDAQDTNPWSYLQDCLGIRGLIVVVQPTDSAEAIVERLKLSNVDKEGQLAWLTVADQEAGLAGKDFLAALARRVSDRTDRALVHLVDHWPTTSSWRAFGRPTSPG
jgi:hypothetical protein